MSMSMFSLKVLIYCHKISPKKFEGRVVKILGPVYMYFSKRSSKAFEAEMAYDRDIQNTVRIAWAYDGALNCGRDQEDWLEEAFDNLSTFLAGRVPPIFIINAMLEHPDTPKLTILKLKAFIRVVAWQHKFKKIKEILCA